MVHFSDMVPVILHGVHGLCSEYTELKWRRDQIYTILAPFVCNNQIQLKLYRTMTLQSGMSSPSSAMDVANYLH